MTSIELYKILKQYWNTRLFESIILQLISNEPATHRILSKKEMKINQEFFPSLEAKKLLEDLIIKKININKYKEELENNPTEFMKKNPETGLNLLLVSYIKDDLEVLFKAFENYMDYMLERNYPNDLIKERLATIGGVTSDEEIIRERIKYFIKN